MRLATLLVLFGCWRSPPPSPPIPSNTATEQKPAEGPLSPGLVTINGASRSFERGVLLGEKGDHYSALIELYKVINGETQDNQ